MTSDLLTDLYNAKLLDDQKMAALQEKMAESQRSGETVELHEKLILIVLLMGYSELDNFLVIIEKYQPALVKHVLGGRSTSEVLEGYRGASAPRPSVSSEDGMSPIASPTATPESSISSVEGFEGVQPMEGKTKPFSVVARLSCSTLGGIIRLQLVTDLRTLTVQSNLAGTSVLAMHLQQYN